MMFHPRSQRTRLFAFTGERRLAFDAPPSPESAKIEVAAKIEAKRADPSVKEMESLSRKICEKGESAVQEKKDLALMVDGFLRKLPDSKGGLPPELMGEQHVLEIVARAGLLTPDDIRKLRENMKRSADQKPVMEILASNKLAFTKEPLRPALTAFMEKPQDPAALARLASFTSSVLRSPVDLGTDPSGALNLLFRTGVITNEVEYRRALDRAGKRVPEQEKKPSLDASAISDIKGKNILIGGKFMPWESLVAQLGRPDTPTETLRMGWHKLWKVASERANNIMEEKAYNARINRIDPAKNAKVTADLAEIKELLSAIDRLETEMTRRGLLTDKKLAMKYLAELSKNEHVYAQMQNVVLRATRYYDEEWLNKPASAPDNELAKQIGNLNKTTGGARDALVARIDAMIAQRRGAMSAADMKAVEAEIRKIADGQVQARLLLKLAS